MELKVLKVLKTALEESGVNDARWTVEEYLAADAAISNEIAKAESRAEAEIHRQEVIEAARESVEKRAGVRAEKKKQGR